MLVQALVEQSKTLPSVCEIVLKKNLLNSDQLLTIFRHQVNNKFSFIQAAKELDLWNDQIDTQVTDHLDAIRIPLGEILVKIGPLTLNQLVLAFDEFLPEREQSAGTKLQEKEIKKPSQPPLSEGDYAPYCDCFDPNLRNKLDSMSLGEQQNLEIKGTIEEIHRLKGAARLVNAAHSAALLESLEKLLSAALTINFSKLDLKLTTTFKNLYKKAIELIWNAQEALKLKPKELEQNSPLARELEAASDEIQVLCFDLDFISQPSWSTQG
jgi:HPt (histidine-containing phosphotransfer) domain-containing protein